MTRAAYNEAQKKQGTDEVLHHVIKSDFSDLYVGISFRVRAVDEKTVQTIPAEGKGRLVLPAGVVRAEDWLTRRQALRRKVIFI